STTQFFLTDALGSIITTFNAVAGSAAVQGNQLYGPYGNNRYSQGTMGTNKGFTGQYADATGLDYYNARYYDPVVGQFLSADVKQGNLQGMDPYGYVGGNPETLTDPTGEYYADGNGNIARPLPSVSWVNSSVCGNVPGCSVKGFDVENASQGEEHWAYHIFIGKQALPEIFVKPIAQWGQGHKDPKVKQPYCAFICGGIKDGMRFFGASLEAGSSAVILAAIVGAGISASASGGLSVFFANFLAGTGIQTFRNLIDGLQGMMDSTAEHNPLIDVFVDVAKALLDLAGIIVNGLSMKGVINASNIKSVQGTAAVLFRILGAAGQVISGQKVNFKNAFGAGISTLQGGIGVLGGFTQLAGDIAQGISDYNTYQAYAADHA
ncbi:MAG TPA: RHS repeat-associated core domain-containing protein, partial [Ktedonosporobacter sp.]|nr:RHS repeat-associated core domain-containing protein [Ktedonosporobacter sp.]